MNTDDLPEGLLDELVANGCTTEDFAAAATLDEMDEILWQRIIRGGRPDGNRSCGRRSCVRCRDRRTSPVR